MCLQMRQAFCVRPLWKAVLKFSQALIVNVYGAKTFTDLRVCSKSKKNLLFICDSKNMKGEKSLFESASAIALK